MCHVLSLQITTPPSEGDAVINAIPFLGDELLDASGFLGKLKTNKQE